MSSTHAAAERECAATDAPSSQVRPPLEPGEIAWLAALPCALLTLAAVVALGPPLANLLPASEPAKFWPSAPLVPEPVEHARYGIVLLGPLLLGAAVLLSSVRRIAPRRSWITQTLIGLSHGALIAFLGLCLLAQNDILLSSAVSPVQPNPIFERRTLIAGAVAALLLLIFARARHPRSPTTRAVADPRVLRFICFFLATTLTALWLLTAVNTEATIGTMMGYNLIPWDMSETFAVLNGRTPLVDFHAQYSQLIPFVAALVMTPLGASSGVWTITMTTLSGIALLSVYGVLRRIVRHSATALTLYLPFMAFGFFVMEEQPGGLRFSSAGIFSAWPMRYASPYLLAWLTARHLDGAAPRRPWLLFAAGGLVAINNPEFGLGAFGGTLLALACLRRTSSLAAAARLIGSAAVGLMAAVLLVTSLTLARAGALPDFRYVLEFAHLYGVDGWYLEQMAPMGLHTAMYVTFAATTVAAIVRAARRVEDPVLTGMLAWSGVFGLGAGSYFLGRSDSLNLITLFSTWGFALALLVVLVIRRLATRMWRLPTLPEFAVLFGFGLMICTLSQLPTPAPQIARLRTHAPAIFREPALSAFVAAATRPGEAVAILSPLGHRVAYDLDLDNVAPYSLPEAMPTIAQLHATVSAMRHAHARKIFLGTGAGAEMVEELERVGFSREAEGAGASMLIDERVDEPVTPESAP